MPKPRMKQIRDYREMEGAASFLELPPLDSSTSAEAGGLQIVGAPPDVCALAAGPTGDAANPGNGSGWFAGGDQDPPCDHVVLDFSEPVRAFGVSFIHFEGAGLDTTQPGRLRVYGLPGGDGEPLAEVDSNGGPGVDFVALAGRKPEIFSAVIGCTSRDASFCVSGYAFVPGGRPDSRD